jgi:hypothetical protein
MQTYSQINTINSIFNLKATSSTAVMPAPSPLAIATSSVHRLVKEEVSYHKELAKQESRLVQTEANLASGDENAEFQLNQEVRKRSTSLLSAIAHLPEKDR